jgi:hypothetical protein
MYSVITAYAKFLLIVVARGVFSIEKSEGRLENMGRNRVLVTSWAINLPVN